MAIATVGAVLLIEQPAIAIAGRYVRDTGGEGDTARMPALAIDFLNGVTPQEQQSGQS